MKESKEAIEIDLKRLVRVLARRLWIILLVGVLVGVLAFGYAKLFIVPTYEANIQMYVNNNYANSPGFSSSQLAAAQNLVKTYLAILRSRSVLTEVAEQTGLGYTYVELWNMIRAQAVEETEVFVISVVNPNYAHATIIANSIADVLPEKISSVVEGSSVRVIDYAVENPSPVGPDYKKIFLIALLAGALVTAVIAVVLDMLDTAVDSEDFLTQAYPDIPLLAVVPETETGKGYKGSYESPDRRPPAKKNGGAR